MATCISGYSQRSRAADMTGYCYASRLLAKLAGQSLRNTRKVKQCCNIERAARVCPLHPCQEIVHNDGAPHTLSMLRSREIAVLHRVCAGSMLIETISNLSALWHRQILRTSEHCRGTSGLEEARQSTVDYGSQLTLLDGDNLYCCQPQW